MSSQWFRRADVLLGDVAGAILALGRNDDLLLVVVPRSLKNLHCAVLWLALDDVVTFDAVWHACDSLTRDFFNAIDTIIGRVVNIWSANILAKFSSLTLFRCYLRWLTFWDDPRAIVTHECHFYQLASRRQQCCRTWLHLLCPGWVRWSRICGVCRTSESGEDKSNKILKIKPFCAPNKSLTPHWTWLRRQAMSTERMNFIL